MEKISLLLLLVKKSLIGSAIAGLISLGGLTDFFENDKQESNKNRVEKETTHGWGRDYPPRR